MTPATKEKQTAKEPTTATLEAADGPVETRTALVATRAENAPPVHILMGYILAELPPIGKTQRNEQQGFMFRGHDDVLNALNPLMAKYGVFVMPDVIERITDQRRTSRGATMYEVNLHVRFRFYGPKGDCVEASGWGEGTDMGDKATSKAMTMAFKYVIGQVFAISAAAAADPDGTTPEETTRGGEPVRQNQPKQDPVMSLPEALGRLNSYIEDGKVWVRAAAEQFYGVEFKTPAELKTALHAQGKDIDFLKRLQSVVARLDAIDGLDPFADDTGKVVTETFAMAFPTDAEGYTGSLEIEWPEWRKPVPFG